MSLRHAVLGLLSLQPSTGYELTQRFDRSLSNAWHASHSQIYPELSKLEAEGLVEVVAEGARRSKTWAATDAGRDELRRWMTDDRAQPRAAQRDRAALVPRLPARARRAPGGARARVGVRQPPRRDERREFTRAARRVRQGRRVPPGPRPRRADGDGDDRLAARAGRRGRGANAPRRALRSRAIGAICSRRGRPASCTTVLTTAANGTARIAPTTPSSEPAISTATIVVKPRQLDRAAVDDRVDDVVLELLVDELDHEHR